MLSRRDFEAAYLVQRVVGRSCDTPVPFAVFLANRAVDGALDPHRPPVLLKVAARPLPPPDAVRTADGGEFRERPLVELRRFALRVPSPVEAPPEFVHLLHGGALHVVELGLPPGAAPVLVARRPGGALEWVLQRRVSGSVVERAPLGDWCPQRF